MPEINFRKSPHALLNTGLVALKIVLDEYKSESKIEYSYDFKEEELTITSDNLFQLLKEVYYFMGREIYDTATLEQIKKKGNVYYDTENKSFHTFPKMNTYGLTHLITNNAQGTTSDPANTVKKTNLQKENPALMAEFEQYFETNNLSMLSKLYLNEPYTKLTRLIEPEPAFFKSDGNYCSLTGEGYKKLVDIQNTSPFISGLKNFNSFLKESDKKISWKAMYLSRFAPKLCLYKYTSKLRDTLVCYFLYTESLENLHALYQEYKGLFIPKTELEVNEFVANFRIHSFGTYKDSDKPSHATYEYTEHAEIMFMLIYTLYQHILKKQSSQSSVSIEGFDPMAVFDNPYIPTTIISFQADEFSSTMRVNEYEEFDRCKPTVQLISYLESEKGGKSRIDFNRLLSSLKFIKPSERNAQNKYRLERQLRNRVLNAILKNKSVVKEIKRLFYDCYKYNLAGEYIVKSYKSLFELVQQYEPLTYKNHAAMDENLQKRSIGLGASMGWEILHFDNQSGELSKKKANAKDARRYLIGLDKARNFSTFLKALKRLQNRYLLSVSRELLELVNEQNYDYIRDFAIISALNQINPVLKPQSQKDE